MTQKIKITFDLEAYYHPYMVDDYIKQRFNPKYWPHQFSLHDGISTDNHRTEDVDSWCYNTIKNAKNWRSQGLRYAFKNEKDAIMFALRWM